MELNWNIYKAKGASELELAEKFVDHISAAQNLQFYGQKTALYFVSSNAGIVSSISFWENALEHSPRFANPGIFPWALANATAGYIARKFAITGPNYTIINEQMDVEQLVSNFQKDRIKLGIKNALCVHWELEMNDGGLSVSVRYTLLNNYVSVS